MLVHNNKKHRHKNITNNNIIAQFYSQNNNQ